MGNGVLLGDLGYAFAPFYQTLQLIPGRANTFNQNFNTIILNFLVFSNEFKFH